MKRTAEYEEINIKLDRVIDAMLTHQDLERQEDRLEAKIDKRFSEVMQSIDNLTKAISELTSEYAAVKTQLARHEEWIRLIAKKNGVKLPL